MLIVIFKSAQGREFDENKGEEGFDYHNIRRGRRAFEVVDGG